MCKNFTDVWKRMCNKNTFDWLGVAFGPGFTLIRLQALGEVPVSAPIPNAEYQFVMLNIVKHLIADMQPYA